jgi:O-antigen ligase
MFATAFGLLVLITALGSRMLRMGLGLLILIPVFAAAVSFTRIGQYASDVFQFRLITLTFEERYTSGREEFPSETVSTWARSPVFGVGLSSYSLMSRTDQSYPHNLFFEVIAEGGVVGALLLLLPFGYTIGLLVTRRVKADPLILSMLGLFLAASQFSGDLYDSRGVLLFLQMALLRPPVDPESRIDGIRA